MTRRGITFWGVMDAAMPVLVALAYGLTLFVIVSTVYFAIVLDKF